jgi:hypothetical protein
MKISLVIIAVLGMLAMIVPLNIFASENNTTFLSPSFNNMSVSQALRMGDLSEQAKNYTKSTLQAADGNYTKLFSILLNDTVKKGILTEEDKNTLSPYLFGLAENDSTKYLSTFKKDISALLEGSLRGNSSANLIALTSILNNTISNIDNNDSTNKTFSHFGSKNVTYMTFDGVVECVAGVATGVGLYGGIGGAIAVGLLC